MILTTLSRMFKVLLTGIQSLNYLCFGSGRFYHITYFLRIFTFDFIPILGRVMLNKGLGVPLRIKPPAEGRNMKNP